MTSRTIRAKHLDSINVGLLRNTIFLSGNGTRAVSTVAITIFVLVAVGDRLAPLGTTLEINVVNVGASVNNVDINALTTLSSVQVFVKGSEIEGLAVRNPG
ncbi:hypothetical protein RRF57_008034 [Xylaria bambusicola]|uniref:Uncharacterized protein n=1 Tax=Xylaria bambusicola TaxID=326684 RepID=A0AAN7UUL7_9PEZI